MTEGDREPAAPALEANGGTLDAAVVTELYRLERIT